VCLFFNYFGGILQANHLNRQRNKRTWRKAVKRVFLFLCIFWGWWRGNVNCNGRMPREYIGVSEMRLYRFIVFLG